jgi:uncharacterized protein
MYAAGREHPYREPCARIILAAATGEIGAVTDAEVIQELAYRYHAIRRAEDGLKLAENFMEAMGSVLPLTRLEVSRSLEIQRSHPFLSPRDATHVAVMESAALTRIVTADRHFEGVPGIERIDPADLAW